MSPSDSPYAFRFLAAIFSFIIRSHSGLSLNTCPVFLHAIHLVRALISSIRVRFLGLCSFSVSNDRFANIVKFICGVSLAIFTYFTALLASENYMFGVCAFVDISIRRSISCTNIFTDPNAVDTPSCVLAYSSCFTAMDMASISAVATSIYFGASVVFSWSPLL